VAVVLATAVGAAGCGSVANKADGGGGRSGSGGRGGAGGTQTDGGRDSAPGDAGGAVWDDPAALWDQAVWN
jgi:hypothetical protein